MHHHATSSLMIGSSPRVWGILHSPAIVSSASRSVHPHVCGEHFTLIVADLQSANGSSPRVWGTHAWLHCAHRCIAVHPHVCGEHIGDCAGAVIGITVHPHVCGEYASVMTVPADRARFIPTCVGNTHARSALAFAIAGSSPRVWGIRCRFMRRLKQSYRFIPTCVGNTWPSACSTCRIVRFIPTCVGNTS